MPSAYFLRRLNLLVKNDFVKNVLISLAQKAGMRYLVVRIDTNNSCNLRCRICPSVNEISGKRPLYMPEEIFQLIGSSVFPKTRMLYFSCGFEPTLTLHLERYIEAASHFKIPFLSLATNGQILTEKMITSFVKSPLHEIVFSMDGGTQATYESIRKGASFEKLNQNLWRLCEKKKEAGSRFPQIRFNYTILKENLEEMETFAGHVMRYSPAVIQFRQLVRYDNISYNGCSVPSEEIEPRLLPIRKMCAQKGIRILLDTDSAFKLQKEKTCPIPDLPAQEKISLPGKSLDRYLMCPVRKFNLYIKSSGDYCLCPFGGTAGNFLEQKGFPALFSKRPLGGVCAEELCPHSCPVRGGKLP